MKCADCKYYFENVLEKQAYCRWMETHLPPQLEGLLRRIAPRVNITTPAFADCQVGEEKL